MKRHTVRPYSPATAVAVAILLVLVATVAIGFLAVGGGGSGTGEHGPTFAGVTPPIYNPAPAAGRKKVRPAKTARRYSWYVGAKRRSAYVSPNEIAVVFRRGAEVTASEKTRILRNLGPGASVAPDSGPTVMFAFVRSGALATALRLDESLKGSPDVAAVSPVFSTDPRDFEEKSALTGQVIVAFAGGRTARQVDAAAAAGGLTRNKRFAFSSNAYLLDSASTLGSLAAANKLSRTAGVLYSAPNWLHTRTKRAVPNDTLYAAHQWHLNNTGQGGGTPGEDINIQPAWDTYKGTTSEVIAIVDDGLQTGHEDLSANTSLGGHWDWIDNNSNPEPGTDDNHGTACAGVAAARGFNALGVTGSASQARLVGYRLLSPSGTTDADEAEALTRNWGVVDVSSNSWGPEDIRELIGPGPLTEDAIYSGAENGRGGKGLIYVWAGGNGNGSGDNSNFDGYANSRFTIAVGASDNDGVQSYYSEPGANLMVNAPSSGGTKDIATTDKMGSAGYNPGPTTPNYYYDFGGTSSAAPLVSGVSALVLQANPNLSWRDVQQILMTTAEKNDPTDSDWTTNGAGYHINHLYGFGRVDAASAVSVATTWTPVGQEESVSASASPGTPIPDNNTTGVSSTVSIPDTLAVEYVDVYFSAPVLDSPYEWWDDLEVTLTSPSGTKSVLANAWFSGASYGYTYDNWRFGSTRHLQESSKGNWTLTVKDLAPDDTFTFDSWRLVVWGTGEPTGTFSINNGASHTTTHTVSLDSTVTNAAEMRFRDETSTWSDWESYAANESWALPAGEGTKTVEAEFRDRLGRVLALSDGIIIDTQAPTGTFVINEDEAEVATATVSLDSTVTDASEMRFKGSDETTWSSWQGYAQQRSWTLPGPDGTKTVDAEFRDTAGNVLSLSDDIRLETGAPSAPSGLAVTEGDATVDLSWTNPIGDFAVTRILRSETDFAGSEVPGGDQTQVYEGSDESTTDAGLTNGQQYFYAFFARDLDGNWSMPATITAVPAAVTELTSTATAVSTAYNTSVNISGVLTSAGTTLTARDTVAVLRSSDGVTWSNDGTATWNATSERYEASRTITTKTFFALRFPGETGYQASQSSGTTVWCRAYLGRPWTVSWRPLRRSWFYTYGYLKPRHTGYTRLYFYRKVRGRWRYVTYRSATNYAYSSYTRYRLKWRAMYPGWWYVRARHYDGDHLLTYSSKRAFYVR